MDIKKLDNIFSNYYIKDYNECILYPSLIVISKFFDMFLKDTNYKLYVSDISNFENDIKEQINEKYKKILPYFSHLKYTLKFLNRINLFNEEKNHFTYLFDVSLFNVIEYFIVNDNVLSIMHEVGFQNNFMKNHGNNFGLNFNFLKSETSKYFSKLSLENFKKITLYINKTNENKNFIFNNLILKKYKNKIEINENYYILKLCDSIFFNKLFKIIKGVKYRNGWCNKAPYLFIIENNDFSKNSFSFNDFGTPNLDNFYKLNIPKNQRNLEIFCCKNEQMKYKEYFFKFKK